MTTCGNTGSLLPIRLGSKVRYSMNHLASPIRGKNVISLVLIGLPSLPFSYNGLYSYLCVCVWGGTFKLR